MNYAHEARHEGAAARPRALATNQAPARRGMVLVFFALLSFVVMGFVALTVDLGIARLTQRQMQSATDGMAMEALRDRDLARVPDEETDDYLRDRRRRQRSARVGSWTFMDRLMTGDDPDLDDTHGAGAWIDMGAGFTGVNASQRIQGAGFSVPRPRPNYDPDNTPLNMPSGDLVTGEYTGHLDQDDDGVADGAVGFGGNPMRVESSKYDRTDFVPAEAEDAPYGSAALARLRRTDRSLTEGSQTANSYDTIPNVSSTGPTIPFLFGLGTTMHGGDPASEYSPRHHGIGVRATSIAEGRPAVRVGPPLGQLEQGGVDEGYAVGTAPIVIFKGTWQESPFLEWRTEADGAYSTVLEYVYETGILAPPDDDSQFGAILQAPRLQRVGDRVYRLQGAAGAAFWQDYKNWEVQEAYAPVIRSKSVEGPWSGRVVGFVRVRTERILGTDDNGQPVQQMKLYKLGNELADEPEDTHWIAPRNASAVFDGLQVSAAELAQDTFLGEEVWSWQHLMWELHGRRNPANDNWITRPLERAVLAPALVR